METKEKPKLELKLSLTNVIINIIIFIIIVIYTSYSLSGYFSFYTVVFNPTNSFIKVKIDGNIYDIAPKTDMNIKIWPGNHNLFFSGSNETFTKEWINLKINYPRKTFLNPTHSFYIMENAVYTKSGKNNVSSVIKIDGKNYIDKYGAFLSEFSGLYTETNYLPYEELPMQSENANLYKIFTKEEFLETSAKILK